MRELEVGELVNGSAVKVGAFPSGSPEWLDARKKGLGGSEISAVVGLNKWESRFSLYYRKLDGLSDITVTPAIEWGTRLESAVFGKYEDELPEGYSMTTGDTFHSLERPWQIVNPDGIVWDELGNVVEILEIKTSPRGDDYGPAGSDRIPIYYRCQLLWYMSALGCRRGTLAVLISGSDYRTYRVDMDDDDIEYLLTAGQKFMDDLANGVEPSITGDMATFQAVRETNPLIDPLADAELPDDIAMQYIAAESAYKAAEAEQLRVKAEILKNVGTAKNIYHGDELIARRQMPGRGYIPYLKYLGPEVPAQTSIIAAINEKHCATS